MALFLHKQERKTVFTPSILGLQKTEWFTEAFIANCFKEKPWKLNVKLHGTDLCFPKFHLSKRNSMGCNKRVNLLLKWAEDFYRGCVCVCVHLRKSGNTYFWGNLQQHSPAHKIHFFPCIHTRHGTSHPYLDPRLTMCLNMRRLRISKWLPGPFSAV